MKLWKYGVSLFIVLFVIFTVAPVLVKKHRQRQVVDSVRAGKVVVEQEMHRWNVCEKDMPVDLSLYIRNRGEHRVEGSAVVTVSLNREGMEEGFIRELTDCYGEERLLEDIRNELEKGEAGRLSSIRNYIMRGKRLPEGKGYEPVPGDLKEKTYAFTLRKPVSLGPGELALVRLDQPVPVGERGGVLSARINTIEFE